MTLADAARELEPRILILDLETRPILAHVWGLWDQRVGLNQIVDEGGVMCWAAKWYGEPTVEFMSDHHDGHEAMIARAWWLLDEAHIVVGWNQRAFDMKHLHREFVRAGFGPPSPVQHVDLLLVARRMFKFPSNRMDWVAKELGTVNRKVQHEGHELWTRCLAGDEKAWVKMRRYNRGDVLLTEELYDRLRGWMPNHPNLSMLRAERVSACTTCGEDDLEDAGWHYTATRAYPRFRCRVCGAHSRSTASDSRRSQHRRPG